MYIYMNILIDNIYIFVDQMCIYICVCVCVSIYIFYDMYIYIYIYNSSLA